MSEGDVLVDDYRLINCVATGSYSQIWEVVEKGGSEHLAMKLLLPEAFKEPEQLKVLKHEAKVSKSLDHANFIRFHKLVANKQHAYVLMDYFRAPNVKSQIMSDLVGLQARLRKLVESLSLALGYMHEQGWVHRDIKPDNILFNKGSELRLIDFSLSARAPNGLTKLFAGKLKVIQGTRTYIAPETIRRQLATRQTDIYSVGVTIYEILTGHPPFRGSSPNDLLKKHLAARPTEPSGSNRNVTPEMDRFVLRLLAKKPKDRPQDMNEVFAEFRSLKVFKDDVQELATQKAERDEQERKVGLNAAESLLDSRADHERSEYQRENPDAVPQKPLARKKPAAVPPAPAPRTPQPVQPQAPGYPPPGYPAPPQYPAGQPAAAGQPAPPPYYPAPQGMPQQYPYPYPYPYPGQPAPYPGQHPGQPAPYPGQPAPPQPQNVPQNPPAPAPPANQPQAWGGQPAAQPAPRPTTPAPQPPASPPQQPAAAPPSKHSEEDDLPFMDELPEVL